MNTHLDILRAVNARAAQYSPFCKVDADLADEAGMDGNYSRQLQAARDLDCAEERTLWLVSLGGPGDALRQRNYLAADGCTAILVRAVDRLEAIEIAGRALTVVEPAVLEAHPVDRIIG